MFSATCRAQRQWLRTQSVDMKLRWEDTVSVSERLERLKVVFRVISSLHWDFWKSERQCEPVEARSVQPWLGQLRGMEQLRYLQLCTESLEEGELQGMDGVLSSLRSLRSLEILITDRVVMGHVQSLVQGLRALTSLESLSVLYRTGSSDVDMQNREAVWTAVGSLTSLVDLELFLEWDDSSPGFCSSEGRAIAGALTQLTSLRYLFVQKYCSCETRTGAWNSCPCCVDISTALSSLSSLTVLDFWLQSMTNEGAEALSRSVGVMSGLTDLNIANNNLDDMCVYLARSLDSCRGLKCLDLELNNLRNHDISSLCSVLGSLPSLTTLNLMEHCFDDSAAVELAGCLATVNPAEELTVFCWTSADPEFTDEGMDLLEGVNTLNPRVSVKCGEKMEEDQVEDGLAAIH